MIMTIAKTILDRISMAWNAPRPSQSPTDPPMADSSFLTEGDLSSVIVTVTSWRPVFAEMYDFSEKLRKGSQGDISDLKNIITNLVLVQPEVLS